MHRQRLTLWIIATMLLCAAIGAFFGHHVGDGGTGNIALISATCAVLGSFIPGGTIRLLTRLRGRKRPHNAI